MDFRPIQPSDVSSLKADEVADAKAAVAKHNGTWEQSGDNAIIRFNEDDDAAKFIETYIKPHKVEIHDLRRQNGTANILISAPTK